MTSQTIAQPHKQPQSQASPYCSDPNCRRCKELREIHDAIRLRQPLPKK